MSALAPEKIHPCPGGCGTLVAYQQALCAPCFHAAHDRHEEERKQKELQAKLVDSGLPLRYRNGEITLDSYDAKTPKQQAALAACREIAEGKGPLVLLLTGGVGVGKTHLAAATLAVRIRAGRGGKFTTLQDLLLHVRSSFDARDVSEYQIVNSYRAGGLLVLDDVGVERASEHSVATLFGILDGRMREGRQTILTSNYKAPQLAQHLGVGEEAQVVAARILDRIIGEGKAIEIDGASQRRRKTA